MATPLPEVFDLDVYRGDDFEFTFQMFMADEVTPDPHVGATAIAQVREAESKTAPLIVEFAVDVSDVANGVFVLSLTAAETGAVVQDSGFWDVQIDHAAHGGAKTRMKGACRFHGEVSAPEAP